MTEPKPESKITVSTVLIGKYRVTREIGRGGMAAVYEAVQLALDKKVAIKVLASELSASTTVIERFFREARAAASVKSPFIVDIYDSGRLEDGRPFIAMEMLDGETLYDLMTRVRLIDPKTTVRIITQCAKGLLKAHAAGIVHRDLKPENIFLMNGDDGEETLKILDFGLAKFYAPMNPDEKTARLTREGAVFGTPAYMSPEQVKGQGTVDHRADLWALGCMTFECLTGRPVWNTEQGVAMTFAAIAASALPVPSQMRPDLPPSFDEWFRKCLQRDPANRFQTAKELAEELARALGEQSLVGRSGGDVDLPSGKSLRAADDSFPSGAMPAPVPSGPSLPAESPRVVGPSAVDMPPTTATTLRSRRGQPLRWAVTILSLAGSGTALFLAWDRMLGPQVMTPIVQSTVPFAPESPAATDGGTGAAPDFPKWQTTIEEGQQLFTIGELPAAQEKFKHAQELGAPAAAVRAYLDETKAGVAGTGDCKMVAFSRPRMGLSGNALRPAVASSAKRIVVSWTDDHEQPGHQHVYAVPLDPAGRPLTRPRDLTPEATEAGRPQLLAVGDRMALLYADKAGSQVGVRVRWIDEEGRIGGATLLVGGVRAAPYWPAFGKAPDGFFVAWEDDRDKDGAQLYLRHLGRELEPISPEIRATDYFGPTGHRPFAKTPTVAVANSALYVAFKLERDPSHHAIERMRVPLDAPLLATGLDDKPTKGNAPKAERVLGDVQLVSEDKAPSDGPDIACGSEGCFVVWHGEKGGAFASLIDPVQGKVVWKKKFSEHGGTPTLGVSEDGPVSVAFYDTGTVRIAQLTRDGVGPQSTFAKVSPDAPRPSLAPGRTKGEWFVAWQDNEGAHTEAYVARITCR
jgi:serine/threonine protein kinase